MFGPDIHQQPLSWHPHPSLWQSIETEPPYRLRDDADGSSVERRNSTFLGYAESWRIHTPVISAPSTLPAIFNQGCQNQTPTIHSAPDTTSEQHYESSATTDHGETVCPSPDDALVASMAIIQIWMSARSRIASLRDMILATRTGMRRERCQCYQQEEEFKQLMDEFMTVLNVTLAHDYDSQHRDTLSRLCRELNRSRNSLTSLRERYATLENILSNYEYQLQSVEEGVYRELEKRLQQHVAPEVIQIDPNSSQTAVPSHLEAVEDMGLRDRLYSRMGDLRIHLERLNNFEFDLREELEERDVLRAEGQVHLTTDTQFFEQARDERARIQQELEEVQTEVQELRKRCNRGGIDYEEPQFPEVLYHTSFRNSASTSDPTGPQPEVQRESSAIISDFFTAQERINQWLEHPSDSPMSDGEVARVNAEERTRRESSSSDLVWVRTPSPTRRPNSMRSVGRHGSADYSLPQWRTGPPPGSSLLEALLLESASTPLGRYASPPEANATPKTGRSLS